MRKSIKVLSATLFLALGLAYAQIVTSTIIGTVSDTSGAVIPGATVTVRNLQTNVMNKVETDGTGSYIVPFLNSGTYSVTVAKPGFKTDIESSVKLDVATKVRVDVPLTVGQATEKIEVQSAGPLVQTDTSSVGIDLTSEKLQQLPLLGRNYEALAQLSPTAVAPIGNMVSIYMPGLTTGNWYQSAGQRGSYSTFTVDGIVDNQLLYQSPAVIPSLDSIGEFQMQTHNFSAEYGFGTLPFVVTTHTGTNRLHGSVYEFSRNAALNAKGYFFNSEAPKSSYNYNQFGLTLGGPILLPKVYDGRNKTFFFFAYEGTRFATGQESGARWPDPAWLTGDFSDLTNPDGSLRVIYNPATVRPDPNNPGGYIRDPFPNNQIPSSMFDPVAMAELPYVPKPGSLTDITPGVNTIGRAETLSSPNYFMARVDQNFSQKDRLYGRYMQSREEETEASLAPLSGLINSVRGYNVMASESHVINSRAVNEFRLGYNRGFYGSLQEGSNGTCITPCSDIDYVDDVFKLKNLSNSPITWGLPLFSWSGYSSVGGPPDNPLSPLTNIFQVTDNLVVTLGRHSMKMGADIRHIRFDQIFGTYNRGGLSFNGQFTQGTQPGQTNSGSPFADFLLGYANQLEGLSGTASAILKGNWSGFYYQDDYRVSPKLTLNLGLRYEYYQPWTDLSQREERFEFGFPIGTCFGYNCPPGRLIGFGPHEFLYDANRNDWSPRVGFSYAPSGGNKTVIRGAYGRYFTPPAISLEVANFFNPPSNFNFFFSPANPYTDLTTTNIGLAFPAGSNPPISKLVTNDWPLPPLSLETGMKTMKDANIEEWQLSVQRELHTNLLLELGYIGSHGVHADGRTNPNQGTLDLPGQLTPVLSRLPYPSLSSEMFGEEQTFVNSYNAATVRLERRFSQGLSLLAAYTWAKTLDDMGDINDPTGFWAQNTYNRKAEWGQSAIDARQRFTAGYVWELPYGRGMHFGSNLKPVLDAVVGGWQVNGITTFQSGFSIVPHTIADQSNTGQLPGTIRPNIVGPVHYMNPRKTGYWFDPSAFAVPALGTFGDASRSVMHGPGIDDWDLAIDKNFHIKERARIEFRTEMFNAFNHTQFAGVNTSIDPSLAGVMGTVASAAPARNIQFGLRVEF